MTLAVTGASTLFGFIIAVFFALVKTYKVRGLHRVVQAFTSFLRGTPVILQLYLVYYVLPMLYDVLALRMGWNFKSNQIPVFILVMTALGMNLAAYLSEAVRAGIEAVDSGEIEAAASLGMAARDIFRRVIFPGAFRVFLPNFSTNVIICLHGSSLAFFVTLVEITGEANILAQYNWRYLETFLAAGLIYWGITVCIEALTQTAELRLNRANQTVV
jgi:L-cystine transport system permease protein